MTYGGVVHPLLLAQTRRPTFAGCDKGLFAPVLVGLTARYRKQKTVIAHALV